MAKHIAEGYELTSGAPLILSETSKLFFGADGPYMEWDGEKFCLLEADGYTKAQLSAEITDITLGDISVTSLTSSGLIKGINAADLELWDDTYPAVKVFSVDGETGDIALSGEIRFPETNYLGLYWGTNKGLYLAEGECVFENFTAVKMQNAPLYLLNSDLKMTAGYNLYLDQENTKGLIYQNSRIEFNDNIYASGEIRFPETNYVGLYWGTNRGFYLESGVCVIENWDGLTLKNAPLYVQSGPIKIDANFPVYFDGLDETKSLLWSAGNTRFEFNDKVYVEGDIDLLADAKVDGVDISEHIHNGVDGSQQVEGAAIKSTYIDAGKVLTADGADGASWETAEGGGNKNRSLELPVSLAYFPAANMAELTKKYEAVNSTIPSAVLLFDKTTSESCFWDFVVDDQYDGGNIIIDIYWVGTPVTGTVIWNIGYGAVAEGENWDIALTVVAFDADTVNGTTRYLNVASKTIAGPWVAGDKVKFKVLRDIADTMDNDAELVGIRIRYAVT